MIRTYGNDFDNSIFDKNNGLLVSDKICQISRSKCKSFEFPFMINHNWLGYQVIIFENAKHAIILRIHFLTKRKKYNEI